MKRILKTVLIVLLIAFIVIQFFKPSKNQGEEIAVNQISAVQKVPADVQQILNVSCNDCHSNTTHYPWYNNFQPVAWVLDDHIVDGKKELNFSVFANYPTYRRYKKFKEISKQVKDGDMPLFSYTLIHRDAVLNADQKQEIQNWTANSIKEMENQFPADSLIKKKQTQ